MRHTLPLAATLCLLSALPAHAGRPLQAEDAGILDARQCELEGAWTRLREPALPRATESGLQVACGIGWRSQLALATSRASLAGLSGQGLRLGGKTEFFRTAGQDSTTVALAWGISSAKIDGAGWEHAATDLNAVTSTPLGAYTLHLNLGHERDAQARAGTTTWAVALEHEGVGGFAPMGEFFGDDRGAPWWNLGLRWTAVPEKAFLDLSYGRQIASGRPALLTAGFKLVF
jgi:hypothetical protein